MYDTPKAFENFFVVVNYYTAEVYRNEIIHERPIVTKKLPRRDPLTYYYLEAWMIVIRTIHHAKMSDMVLVLFEFSQKYYDDCCEFMEFHGRP